MLNGREPRRAKRRKRRRSSFFERISLPPDVWAGNSDVCISSDREVNLYGCRRILGYDPTEVFLELNDRLIRIGGDHLTLKTFFARDIRVCGHITSVSLEDKER